MPEFGEGGGEVASESDSEEQEVCSRPVRLLAVFELGPQVPSEWMMPELLEALKRRGAVSAVRWASGFLKAYQPGGIMLSRILNLLFVFIRLPFDLMAFRPDAILVRTSPPLIQIWVVCLAAVARIPVVCWLMDYHPEIEARMAEQRGLHLLAKMLRRLDKWALTRMKGVVAIDEAMATMCQNRVPGLPIVVHPTWRKASTRTAPTLTISRVPQSSDLCLAHVGNLGIAHDTSTLKRLLKMLKGYTKVRLVFINLGGVSRAAVEDLSRELDIPVVFLPRADDLGALVEHYGCDLGVVLMKNAMAGLVSPSKFSGYISSELPVLYIGPSGTNAELVANRFGAGISLPNLATDDQLLAACKALSNREDRIRWHHCVPQAVAYFDAFGGDSMAQTLEKLLKLSNSPESG